MPLKWPWQSRRAERPNSFMVDLDEVENDCMRRLDYVDTQLDRAVRSRRGTSPFSAAMTVADMDIIPMGRNTQVMSAVRALGGRRLWLALGVGALALLVIIFVVARCNGAPPTPLEGP